MAVGTFLWGGGGGLRGIVALVLHSRSQGRLPFSRLGLGHEEQIPLETRDLIG